MPVAAVRTVWNVVLGISERNSKESTLWDSGNLIKDACGNLAESGALDLSVCAGRVMADALESRGRKKRKK